MRGLNVNSGPAPDPDSLRQSKASIKQTTGEWVRIPRSGRQEPFPPPWPLDPNASPREWQIWTEDWKKPQALMWERLGLERQVANYVRQLAEAERMNAGTNVRILLHRQMEALGLTALGLRALRWMIVEDETARGDSNKTNK